VTASADAPKRAALTARLIAFLRAKGRSCEENVKVTLTASLSNVEPCIKAQLHTVQFDVFSRFEERAVRHQEAHLYQVAVTRSDFLALMAQCNKRAVAEWVCEGFYIVAPAGVLAPEEIPAHYGLLTPHGESGFTCVKSAMAPAGA
jgi:tRNA splicing ligase